MKQNELKIRPSGGCWIDLKQQASMRSSSIPSVLLGKSWWWSKTFLAKLIRPNMFEVELVEGRLQKEDWLGVGEVGLIRLRSELTGIHIEVTPIAPAPPPTVAPSKSLLSELALLWVFIWKLFELELADKDRSSLVSFLLTGLGLNLSWVELWRTRSRNLTALSTGSGNENVDIWLESEHTELSW